MLIPYPVKGITDEKENFDIDPWRYGVNKVTDKSGCLL